MATCRRLYIHLCLKTGTAARHAMYELEPGDCCTIDHCTLEQSAGNYEHVMWHVFAFNRAHRKRAGVPYSTSSTEILQAIPIQVGTSWG